MSNSTYPQYPWLIDFTDLTDASIKKFGDPYLYANPDPTKNYYLNTANALISLANSKGVDVNFMNAVGACHYLITNWQIAYLHEQVCINNIGLSYADSREDMFAKKQHIYHQELMQLQMQIRYETFQTPNMQQAYTRAYGRIFDITY